jgi:hypothetical protein
MARLLNTTGFDNAFTTRTAVKVLYMICIEKIVTAMINFVCPFKKNRAIVEIRIAM